MNSTSNINYSDFIPLGIIFAIIIAITGGLQWYHGFSIARGMNDFMAAFFLIFGSFKLFNWSGFVQAYTMYDIVAKRSTIYAYMYPLIEITLGILYAFRVYPIMTNSITILVMVISSVGVIQQLQKKEVIPCACLGTVFKLPMTYVTVFEDILMAVMALCMLINYL